MIKNEQANHSICLGDVGIIGLAGRMGQRIISCLEKQKGYRSIGGYDRVCSENEPSEKGSKESLKKVQFFSTLDELFEKSSLVLDFSAASLFPDTLRAGRLYPRPMVVGTTGISQSMRHDLSEISQNVPIVVAPNTSLGAVIQRWVAGKLSQFLPNSYDIDIVETHHRYKQDSPSGTALALADAIIEAKRDLCVDISVGTTTSPRKDNRIEMHALRCGHVSGMHDVIWTGADDRLVFGHTVFSPHIFADGAIVLARWLAQGQNPGIYRVEDVLGLTN